MIRFIKDDPSELEDGIWLMPPLYSRTWQWIKRKVNFEEGFIPMQDGTTFHIHKGEHLTSVRKVSEGIGWYEGKAWKEPNPKTVSKILEWLEKNEYLEIKRGRGNREYTLICLSEREKTKLFKKGVTANGEGVGEGREQLADINKKNLEESKKKENENIKYVFEYWNSKKIKVHRECTEKLKGNINARLEVHGLQEILNAMDAYNEVISDQETYWYSHKFTLTDFMNPKNLDRFLAENDPLESHKKKPNSFSIKPTYQSKAERAEEQRNALKQSLFGGANIEDANRTRSRVDITPNTGSFPQLRLEQ